MTYMKDPPNVPVCGVSVCLSTIVLAGDLGVGLGFLPIVLESDLDLNSCFFTIDKLIR